VRSLGRSSAKSDYCFVVIAPVDIDLVVVKANQLTQTKKQGRPVRLGLFSRRSRTAHDRWLIFSMHRFNSAGGWEELLARQQAQQFTG